MLCDCVRQIKKCPRVQLLAVLPLGTVLFQLFLSCASTRFDAARCDSAYKDGNYGLCMRMLEHKDYGKEDAALKGIDMGVLAHYKKDYRLSAQYFDKSDRLLDSNKAGGVAQFESFFLNVFNALNYYHQNKLEDAVVELKKADDIKIRAGRENRAALWHVVDKSGAVDRIRGFDEDAPYADNVRQAYNTFGITADDVEAGAPRKPTVQDLYQGSVTAYYLGALMRNANGDTEGARLDADYVRALSPSLPLEPLLHSAVNAETNGAVLHVISFSGSIAQKKEKAWYFPPEEAGTPMFLPGIAIPIEGTPFTIPPIRFKFAYPIVEESKTHISHVEAVITDLEKGTTATYPLTLLEDFGSEVKKHNALKARREYRHNVAKSILGKLGAALTSGSAIFAARKTLAFAEDALSQLLAEAALTVAEAALPAALDKSDAPIRADIRQAKYLPAKASVAAIPLAPSVYTVKVRYFNKDSVLFEETFDNVEIRNKKFNLLESLCLR